MKKNAIITGASGGIGMSIVEEFAGKGINIWAHASSKKESFEDKLKELEEQFHVWIHPVYFNLEKEEEVINGLKEIFKEKKTIDILVNNAAVSPRGLLSMTSMNELRRVMEINYISQLCIIQMVSRVMVRQKNGSIVNIGSVSGCQYAERGGVSYGGSKSALLFATRVIAKELADYNIRVNAVSPGFVETEMWIGRPDTMLKEAMNRSVMKRMGHPREIAKVVSFLVSEDASYMTGTNVIVQGGGE